MLYLITFIQPSAWKKMTLNWRFICGGSNLHLLIWIWRVCLYITLLPVKQTYLDMCCRTSCSEQACMMDSLHTVHDQPKIHSPHRHLYRRLGLVRGKSFYLLILCSKQFWRRIFKASALWADAFYKSKCPSVCVSVRVSVHFWGTI